MTTDSKVRTIHRFDEGEAVVSMTLDGKRIVVATTRGVYSLDDPMSDVLCVAERLRQELSAMTDVAAAASRFHSAYMLGQHCEVDRKDLDRLASALGQKIMAAIRAGHPIGACVEDS